MEVLCAGKFWLKYYDQENVGGSNKMSQVLSAGAMMVTPDSRYSLVNRNCKLVEGRVRFSKDKQKHMIPLYQ